MVFVKVRETYDLHTLRNKLTLIGVHTPSANIIKRNYPGLLMQCKTYRPVSCDVRIACASMLPLDPLGVGTSEGDVAPEDVFNPILYKAVSNQSMNQIEQNLHTLGSAFLASTTSGDSVEATNNGLTSNDFNIYYGLLSDTNGWKHAAVQSGLSMASLRPLVYEAYYSIGENSIVNNTTGELTNSIRALNPSSGYASVPIPNPIRGSAHPLPMMNTTCVINEGSTVNADIQQPGFGNVTATDYIPGNAQTGVPAPKIFCGCIIIPPSRLHQLFFRMVVEWTLEFSSIRSLAEITTFNGLVAIGVAQHIQDYSYDDSKVLTDTTDLVDTSEGTSIHKVM